MYDISLWRKSPKSAVNQHPPEHLWPYAHHSLYQPNWMSEAIVYSESMDKYSGRMNGAISSIVTSLTKKTSCHHHRARYNNSDFTLANRYVFGGDFKYLADTMVR